MYYAFRHHLAVIDRIAELNEMDYDAKRDIDPVSARARDKAMHFLGRRPDLSIGMSVSATKTGGLILDFIRHGREYLVKIEEKGVVSVLAGTDGDHKEPVSIISRAITLDFLSQLDTELPDPIGPNSDPASERYRVPASGMIASAMAGRAGVYEVRTDTGTLLGFRNQKISYGFDLTCFRVPEGMNTSSKKVDEIAREVSRIRGGVMLARRFNKGPLVSLHDLTEFPKTLLANGSLQGGCKLIELQEEVALSAA